MSHLLYPAPNLTMAQTEYINQIRHLASHLYGVFEQHNSREMSLAKTNLEQAVMWGVKAVSLIHINNEVNQDEAKKTD